MYSAVSSTTILKPQQIDDSTVNPKLAWIKLNSVWPILFGGMLLDMKFYTIFSNFHGVYIRDSVLTRSRHLFHNTLCFLLLGAPLQKAVANFVRDHISFAFYQLPRISLSTCLVSDTMCKYLWSVQTLTKGMI